jgi:peptidyl-prolyl cis-trans isomerase SurA
MLKQLVVAATLAAVSAWIPLHAEVVEQVLVKVNGEIITKSEFETRQVQALSNRPELAKTSAASLEFQKAVAQITPDLILNAVDELLLIQRGRESGYTLGDQQFATIVEGIRKSNNLEDEARFKEALKQEGLTMDDLRRNLERTMIVQQVTRVEIMDKISINDEEARAYYDQHRNEFTSPTEITLREILIEVPTSDRGVNVAEDDAARDRAEEVRKRLLAGEPFPRLAGEVSAASSKANGGLIGPIHTDELAPQLRDLLQPMQVGDITGVLRTQRGYQILKLETRTDSKVKTFEEARGDIANRIGDQKLRGEREKYLDRLREQATITWRNTELQKAYETALARRHEASGSKPQASTTN